MIHRPEFFKGYELVDKDTYEKFGEEKSFWFIAPRVLQFIDLMRSTYGPIIINDWKWGGAYEWSGFRYNKSPVYNPWSQHSLGNAVDMKFKDVTTEEVREDLRDRWGSYGSFPLTVELDVSWIHADFRPQNKLINFFKP